MKLLVFAHTPPPHHGQSAMVALMLDALGRDPRFELHHVNARVSDDLADVGGIRPVKLLRLLGHCARAIALRFRHGIDALYFVPAPAKRSAIVRDAVAMLLLRPFFPERILHWHAVGLGEWAAGHPPREAPVFPRPLEPAARRLVRAALGRASLAIVLTEHNRADAARFAPARIAVVPNGIPDPCPDFESLLAARQRRLAERLAPRAASSEVRALFLAHCTRDKGLFDALEAVALANAARPAAAPRFRLTVAGSFMNAAERREFDARVARPDLADPASGAPDITYAGFISGAEKGRLLRESDCMVFPSHWESFGLAPAEAFAHGLPAVITDIPNLVAVAPAGYPLLAPPRDPARLAKALDAAARYGDFAALRAHFTAHLTAERHAAALANALAPPSSSP